MEKGWGVSKLKNTGYQKDDDLSGAAARTGSLEKKE